MMLEFSQPWFFEFFLLDTTQTSKNTSIKFSFRLLHPTIDTYLPTVIESRMGRRWQWVDDGRKGS